MKATYTVTRAEQGFTSGLYAVTLAASFGELTSAELFATADEALAAGERALAFLAAEGKFPNMCAAF